MSHGLQQKPHFDALLVFFRVGVFSTPDPSLVLFDEEGAQHADDRLSDLKDRCNLSITVGSTEL